MGGKKSASLHCVCAQFCLVMARPAPCCERSRSAVITHLSAVWNIHGQVGPMAPSQSHGFLIIALPSSCFTPPGHCAQNAASHSPLSAWRHSAGAWPQSATLSVSIGSGWIDAIVCDCLVVCLVLWLNSLSVFNMWWKAVGLTVQPISKVETSCRKCVFCLFVCLLFFEVSAMQPAAVYTQRSLTTSRTIVPQWAGRHIDFFVVVELASRLSSESSICVSFQVEMWNKSQRFGPSRTSL